MSDGNRDETVVPRRGRPNVDPQKVRQKVVGVRLTEADYQAWSQAAKAAGQPLSRWSREAIAGAMGKRAPAASRNAGRVNAARAIERQLRALGNDLNEAVAMCHAAARAGRISEALAADAVDAFTDLAEPIAEIRAWTRSVK